MIKRITYLEGEQKCVKPMNGEEACWMEEMKNMEHRRRKEEEAPMKEEVTRIRTSHFFFYREKVKGISTLSPWVLAMKEEVIEKR